MTAQLSPQAALLLVDIQQGFDEHEYWGPRNNPDAEDCAASLLMAWRHAGRPVAYAQHHSQNPASPLHPSKIGVAINTKVAPLDHEPVMQKSVNSAFIGTQLESWLREHDVDQIVIAGLTTNQCVETTTRMANNLGLDPVLVEDACAANDLTGPDGKVWPAAMIHAMSVANLHAEFATIMRTTDLIPLLEVEEAVSTPRSGHP
jgi:nicotinamidase-related amidase